ncbi:hypothetical protein ACHAAC_11865 [Aeromicrobium sp. CF4.19]|uniref:hypothetical protein n=1 Tax=Aeromicrobium sp. CF4.19 TaxID=3373082 RepID=UPI003EE603C4
MTWDAYHRRKTALKDMLALADRHRESTLEELIQTVPGAAEAFDDPQIALFDAQMLFVQRVRGRADMLIGDGVGDDSVAHEEAVVQAWASAASMMPGARVLLDAAEARGELSRAFAKERALLATMAGVPPLHPDLDGHGDRLREQARSAVDEQRTLELVREPRGGLMARLRDALAA